MLLQPSSRLLRQRTWTRPGTSVAVSTLRVLATHRTFTQPKVQTQTRLSSSDSSPSNSIYEIPHLSPPWGLEDLSRREQEAYVQHGPNYAEKMSSKSRAKVAYASQARDRLAHDLEKELGPDWYDIHTEAKRMATERESMAQKLAELSAHTGDLSRITDFVFRDTTLSVEEQKELSNQAMGQRQEAREERIRLKQRVKSLNAQFRKEIKAARDAQAKKVAVDDMSATVEER